MLPFGSSSLAYLGKANIDLQVLFEEVNKDKQCTILNSIRTLEEEKIMVAKGLSTTLNSKHLPGPDGKSQAVDVAPDPVNFERKNFAQDQILFAGFVLATALRLKREGKITHNIIYGGKWKKATFAETSFEDLDHYEIE